MKHWHNGRVYSFDARRRLRRTDSLTIDGAGVVAVGADPVGLGAERIDLDGAAVLPAFADCHVHLAETGYYAGDRNLARTRSYDEFSVAVAGLQRAHGIVLAGGYDDAAWAEPADARSLEYAHSGADALISRVDGHSCVVNARTFALLNLPPEIAGIERDAAGAPTGKLFLEANWRARATFEARIPTAARRDAERAAAELALSRGALHVHVQLLGIAPGAYEAELAALRALPLNVHPKICEPDASLAHALGLPYVGGDVFLDGSIGSRTAALCAPYADAATSGTLRYTDDELLAYYAQAEALGIGAGVHAIGDAAIEQSVRVWERVLRGRPSPRGSRHFIEHFELATTGHMEACARMGIALSVQPPFDASWGGEGGMYDVRLGPDRRRTMNAFASIAAAGARMCAGSDSPVCALAPLAGMQACVEHREVAQRLSPAAALAACTVDAAWLGYAEHATGNLQPGLAGDFVVLDRDPFEAAGGFRAATVRETWSAGKLAWKLP